MSALFPARQAECAALWQAAGLDPQAASREALLGALATALGHERAEVSVSLEAAACAAVLPAALARRYGALPLPPFPRNGTDPLRIALADPFDREAGADLAFALQRPVTLVVADPAALAREHARIYGPDAAPAPAAVQAAAAEEPSVVALVERILACAVEARASDVHFEAFAGDLRVRLRLDGLLVERERLSGALRAPVAARLKVLAGLDVAETRLPQDGRIRFAHGGRTVDLRLSTLPTAHGESLVVRVLDAAVLARSLEELGMGESLQEHLRATVQRPHGLFVVSGPTGSGKTTTLYAALRTLDTATCKVFTVEDPVEYALPGIVQVPVHPGAGLTFAGALRSLLRQDPDKILVGEIRDSETARVAVQAALTGHLVLATLHTADAATAVHRLLDLGVEPFLLAASLRAVLAQRLVRLLCPHCRAQEGEGFTAPGCARCHGTGASGRAGLFEWMEVTAPLREAITARAPAAELRSLAGSGSLREAAAEAVRAGRVSAGEARRVLEGLSA